MNSPDFIARFRNVGRVACGLLACGLAIYGSAGSYRPVQVIAMDDLPVVADPRPLSPDPRPVQDGTAKARDITFDTIKLEMKKGDKFKKSLITPAIEALKGTRVKVRGYMYPTFQQDGIKNFVLVRDNMECCFGPGALIHDCILVVMSEGTSTSYNVRPIAVEGTFEIEPQEGDDGEILVLYHLKNAAVR
jgi:hypothetical protein